MTELISINPSDGSTVWRGSATPVSEIAGMAGLAKETFPEWSSTELDQREGILRNLATVLQRRSEEIATLISREIGKPLWESRTEVAAMVGKVEISITAHRERCHEFHGGKAITRFRPHGVIAVIGPYNFPGHLPNGHICPALLAGNVVLFKPSELAPATGKLLVDCWHEAGVPDKVLQLVQGGPDVAKALVAVPQLNGVFFTGSARTGVLLSRQFAGSPGKILALEMGGNNPMIADPANISNLEAAVKIVVNSAFLSAGQRCTCARRLVLLESEASGVFIENLVHAVRGLKIDHPFADPEPFMGPLASPGFPEQILRQQAALVEDSGNPILAACAMQPGTGFMSPGIIDVSPIQNLPDEEIFGPLLQIQTAPNLDEAIRLANNTRFGLASGVLTDDRKTYEYARNRLHAGIINWNTQLTGASSAAPFGGIRDSGNLRPSAFFAADYCSYPVASIEEDKCL